MRTRLGLVPRTMLAIGALAASVAACDAEPSRSERPDRIPSQDGWTQPLANPVIKAGDLRKQGLWNDPSVLKENGLYVMYMTTSIEEPFKPPIVPFPPPSPAGPSWKLDP